MRPVPARLLVNALGLTLFGKALASLTDCQTVRSADEVRATLDNSDAADLALCADRCVPKPWPHVAMPRAQAFSFVLHYAGKLKWLEWLETCCRVRESVKSTCPTPPALSHKHTAPPPMQDSRYTPAAATCSQKHHAHCRTSAG